MERWGAMERWAFYLWRLGGFGEKRTRLTFLSIFVHKILAKFGGVKSEGRVLVTGIATLEKANEPKERVQFSCVPPHLTGTLDTRASFSSYVQT